MKSISFLLVLLASVGTPAVAGELDPAPAREPKETTTTTRDPPEKFSPEKEKAPKKETDATGKRG